MLVAVTLPVRLPVKLLALILLAVISLDKILFTIKSAVVPLNCSSTLVASSSRVKELALLS